MGPADRPPIAQDNSIAPDAYAGKWLTELRPEVDAIGVLAKITEISAADPAGDGIAPQDGLRVPHRIERAAQVEQHARLRARRVGEAAHPAALRHRQLARHAVLQSYAIVARVCRLARMREPYARAGRIAGEYAGKGKKRQIAILAATRSAQVRQTKAPDAVIIIGIAAICELDRIRTPLHHSKGDISAGKCLAPAVRCRQGRTRAGSGKNVDRLRKPRVRVAHS